MFNNIRPSVVILIGTVLLVVASLCGLIYALFPSGSYTGISCTNYYGFGPNIINCYGDISLQRSGLQGKPTFSITNHNHGYNLAFINNKADYTVQGNFLYVIARKEDADYELISKKYFWFFSISGDGQSQEYDNIEDLPNYLKVRYGTGVVTPYLTYNEMSAEDQGIFHVLEDRMNK